MKFNIDKKTAFSIATILAVGLVLAMAILLWKKEPSAVEGENEGERAEETGGKAPGAERADKPGLIAMTPQQVQSAGIVLASAGPASIDSTVTLPGEVRFNEDRTAHIVPRVAGVVESVSASLGQEVSKGQELAVIASAELAELRSAALAAGKRLELARVTYEREKRLWEDRISAQQDYLQAEQAYREAQIELQSARAKLTALGAATSSSAVNRYVLRAPFNGVVVEKHLAQGEAVKEDANVFLVSDLSSVWVEIAVAPKDLQYVRVGQAVTIKPAGGSAAVDGKVSYVGSLLGEQTRTATARVVIDNPGRAWRPGLFVNVSVVRGKTEAPVTVATDAVQTIDGKPVVFVKAPEGFQARQVSTGASDGKVIEIKDGLVAGTQYVATGSFVVKAEQAKGSAEHEH
ncbi:efflux RND transporter periplasmic adaptor subunit [Massilia sp. G4R7]|uniref:Efflux RND transporter periplasmic adaptor subunit n=1 Tax=Massilia phyllostachyos TaxID=2898585 RepID=A0ABS8Q6P6_9BURK|nr:efflux RND transporter periplasmic adaptor subunit [Massilia phyllostachyos]MCD2516742.1 efflux RND transporter periplasmic adaptor subunit [Massilia phyllostachyos]